MQSVQFTHRRRVSVRVGAVTKLFGETVALWDADLDGRSGELIAIHGANGSGKTTLLRIIAGLVSPTRGRITWATTATGTRTRIGLLGHATHLFDDLTALENVALAARLARVDESVAIDLLGRLGVARYAGQRAGALSAGNRRRVGLARVLAADPDVVLVDEPFAGLDQAASELVIRSLTEARSIGRLVMIATHDDARSRSIATTAVRLEHGHLRREPSSLEAIAQ